MGETSQIKTRLQVIAIFMFKINKTLLLTNTWELFRGSLVDYTNIPRARTVTYANTNVSDRNEISLQKIKDSIKKKDLEGPGGLIQEDLRQYKSSCKVL